MGDGSILRMIYQVLEDREARKVEETLRCVVGVETRL